MIIHFTKKGSRKYKAQKKKPHFLSVTSELVNHSGEFIALTVVPSDNGRILKTREPVARGHQTLLLQTENKSDPLSVYLSLLHGYWRLETVRWWRSKKIYGFPSWGFLGAFVWGGGAGHFLSYFSNSGISKHRFDQLCVEEIEQARAELSYAWL